MFDTIDRWLIRQHQKVANWTDVRYDKNCYWWGYALTELLCPVIFAHALLVCFTTEWPLFMVIGTLLWLLYLVVELIQLARRRNMMHSRTPVIGFNSTNNRQIFFWLFLINAAFLFSAVEARDLTIMVIILCITSRGYFDACLPMPPHEKEKRQSELFAGVPEAA